MCGEELDLYPWQRVLIVSSFGMLPLLALHGYSHHTVLRVALRCRVIPSHAPFLLGSAFILQTYQFVIAARPLVYNAELEYPHETARATFKARF